MNNWLKKGLYFGTWGAGGGTIGSLVGEPLKLDKVALGLIISTVYVGIWFGVIGACISVALLSGSSYYLKREFRVGQSAREGASGFLSGAIAGAIAQVTYSGIGPTEFLRVICWGIAGGLLGLGLSFRIPNLGHWRGLGGGVAGGVLGGCLFILFIYGLSTTAGRLFGTAAIGFFIGLMIVLVEAVFRQAWLEISYRPKEIRTVTLGSELVSLGSDSNKCTVYIHNAPLIALRYKLEQGHVMCEDIALGHTTMVSPGDRKVIGNITVSVCATGSSAKLAATTPASLEGGRSFTIHLSSGHTIQFTEGMKLRETDIPELKSNSLDCVVAEVNRNPNDPTILGLKNLSRQSWAVTIAAGERKQIDSGRSIKLAVGTKINFGYVTGEIC